MSRSGGTTLYVTGFGQGTRARDLAYEFERYGRLVRCDIPAPRTASSRLFAFVEYESRRDADDAYYEMHGRRIRDDILKIEWARTPPSASWRFEGGRDGPRGGGGGGGGGRRSPRRGSARSISPRGRRGDDRAPLSPPPKSRDRSRSPIGKEDLDGDRDMNRGSPRDDHDRDDRHRSSDRDAKDSPPLHDDLDTADAE